MTEKSTEKVALVTGGTRGIGLEISRSLAADGYKVVALYHGNKKAAKACEEELDAKTYQVDVSDFDACQKVVATIEEKVGPIYVLVNNAGITRDGALHKMAEENWHQVIETNLTSCFNLCRAVMSYMRDRQDGRVINISSINGQKGQFGQTNYAAAKAGMIGFTKSLALESAIKNITVNAICPGYIETDMTGQMNQDVLGLILRQIPAGRLGQPQEIAGIVSFLASEKAAFINGATISANGGQYMV
ncbi:MAG: acetoacetyl-CoA reductase [Alphaproteobacteria bacterium]|jgi:acetoacetyl-CoA reductase|nr:acetoacetyl-CoA reductase [Alphaproteobacteria bacterium]MDP7222834.1 acetoacetyl-CoA reductase [Alphaproteobacteria bacterium]